MVTINSLKFDTMGWSEQETSPTIKAWFNPELPETLQLHFSPLPPKLPFNLTEIKVVREYLDHDIQQFRGEVVELAVETIQGFEALRSISKFPIPENDRGRIYLGSYMLPFAFFSYVIKVRSQEIGITGQREAWFGAKVITERDPEMMEIMENPAQGPEVDDGWGGKAIFDPRLSKIAARAIREEYDAQFPNHPVNRVRAHLRHILATLVIDDAVKKSKRFRKRI